MSRIKQPGKLQLLGVIFLTVVVAVVAYTHQLVIPVFLGLFAWGKLWAKIWVKSLTPKLGLLLVKNSVFIHLRRLAVQVSAHLFVKSHKPWRRFLTRIRLAIVTTVKDIFAGYLNQPLWLRTAIAITVLIATAGSSFAVFALLIIPQPLLDWLRARSGALLNRLGVTRLFSALWRFAVPETLRQRWYMYVKWTLGRRQVAAAKRLHDSVARKTPGDLPADVTETG